MPGHGTRSVRAWRAVHRLLRPLLIVWLLQSPRSESGHCTNSCRWDYKVENAAENETGDLARIPVETIKFDFNKALEDANQSFSAMGDMPRHPLADRPYLIEESTKPGQLMPILEDEHGTYIMNSKDLRAVEHVERLAKIGVDSLKVEGRTKSLYYVARTAQVSSCD
jgi:putative protease